MIAVDASLGEKGLGLGLGGADVDAGVLLPAHGREGGAAGTQTVLKK